MLKQRVITAVILLAILLPALFWRTPEPFLAKPFEMQTLCDRVKGLLAGRRSD
jgi:hypothetical protein